MASFKRKRGCNYTYFEKEIVLELIKKHLDVIENKGTTGVVLRDKQQAWTNVAKKYNAVASSGHRTWAQLRHLYENLKQKAKKNAGERHYFWEKDQLKNLKPKAVNDKEDEVQIIDTSPEPILLDVDEISKKKEVVCIKKLQTKKSLKERYLRIKMNNAILERKFMVEKHKLEMTLLKMKINNEEMKP